MDICRYHETEKLLKIFPDMRSRVQSLRKEIETLHEGCDENDDIRALALGRNINIEGTPNNPSHISDKTSRLGLGYNKQLSSEKKIALLELKRELLLLETVIDKINIAVAALSLIQRNIIDAKYWKNKTWVQISLEFSMAETTAQTHRKLGVTRVMTIARVSIENYQQILKLFEI